MCCNNETEAALGATSETRCLPSKSGSTEGCSSCFGRTLNDSLKWGKRNCIATNYDKLYTLNLMYYMCATRSEMSEVRGRDLLGLRCQFQCSRNRLITASLRESEPNKLL